MGGVASTCRGSSYLRTRNPATCSRSASRTTARRPSGWWRRTSGFGTSFWGGTMASRSELEERVAGAIRAAVREAYGLELDGIHVERPSEAAHGDFATNVALANAKVFRRNPREEIGR